ncbi:MAG: CDP-diacylglycerol--glycerol-3-phosphate 3-phosphatidyltransferase, partial [Ferrovibrionaceae bacterium]
RRAMLMTTVQLVALGFLLDSEIAPPWTRIPEIGIALLWIAALLTLYTGYDYMQSGLKHMTAIDEQRKG